ncbi:MAG: NAD-dependent epimerase/dehydratase family protein [Bacillota bacterium]|nr:NAD-dependent epimerase/dehydratase family protein [Bacillota bacterium]
MKKILVTGAMGQIGTELVPYLRNIYGLENVVASGRRIREECTILYEGPFELIDITRPEQIDYTVKKYEIDTIYHLASMLSARGESNPQELWEINMNGLVNVLEIARAYKCSLFFPSSIAVFGPDAPKVKTPQDALTRPTSIYGVSKVSGELLCDYYHLKYDLDIRGLRYPGVISSAAMPGGGTTDYAVHIFYDALKKSRYTCFLKEDSSIDMIYMPDVLEGAVQLMEADPFRLQHRNAFNVSAITVTPLQLAAEIKKHLPQLEIDYEIDPVRQSIADSWPDSLDDSAARSEWGWNPKYDLTAMTKDMLSILSKKLK